MTLTLAPGAILLLGFIAGVMATFISIFIYAVLSKGDQHGD